MDLTTRAAIDMLVQVGIGRGRAAEVLRCGLGGEPTQVGRERHYDLVTIQALVARRTIPDEDLDRLAGHGLFVARRTVDVRASTVDQLARLRHGWDLSWPLCLMIQRRIELDGPMPLIATTGGFVTAVALIDEVVWGGGRNSVSLALTPRPSSLLAWLAMRYPTGPGRDWVIRGWQLLTATERLLTAPVRQLTADLLWA